MRRLQRNMLKKVFLVMMMALLFCTAAAAEEVTIDVTTAKQLVEAVDAANAAGAATPEGQTAPLYRIRIMNDIHDDCSVSKGWLISVENGARVIVEGVGAEAPVLTMDWSSMGYPSYGGFVSLFEAQLRLVNLTFDFQGSEKSPGVGGLILYSGELEAENCTLRNMKPWKGSLAFAPRAAVVSLGGSLKMKKCTVENIETYNMFPDNGAIALLATDA